MKIKPADDSKWRSENGDYTYRINYDLTKESIVVDLGARHAHWADLIRNKYGSKIYCFEAVPEFSNELKNKGYDTFNLAVSDSSGTTKLSIHEHEASIFYETENSFEITSIPASQIFNLIDKDHIDLIKINVEGAEYPILTELISTQNITKINNLQVQFHLFDNDDNEMYQKIFDELSKTHELTWRFPFVWENWKRK